ncbi:MAG: carbon storage regulator [Nautilia sp.]|nr:MAG: carbon storage regulator [Nautilia sp.]
MLVIARRIGEELKIGDDIVIKVINIDKNQVKIGIDAPRNVAILRMELIKEITNQNRLANNDTDENIIHSLYSMIKGQK